MSLTLDQLSSLPENVGVSEKKGRASATLKRRGDTLLFTARSDSLIAYCIARRKTCDETAVSSEKERSAATRFPSLFRALFSLVVIAILLFLCKGMLKRIIGK